MNYYKTVQGDTWDSIAFKVYGDELLADRLMKANYDKLDYFEFPAGVKINAPNLDSIISEEYEINYPEWRRTEAIVI